MKEYKIILNENQLRVLEQALEAFSRIGTKQYDIVADYIETSDKFGILSWNQRQEINESIRQIEGFDMPSNASPGIHSPDISDKFRVAYDMIQVLRYARSWANADDEPSDRNKNFSKYMTVNYDTPMKTSTEEALCKCQVIEPSDSSDKGEVIQVLK